MGEWLAEYGIAIGVAIVGMLVCTGAGLLSLTPDPERPTRFLPVYLVAMTLYVGGLYLVLWCDELAKQVSIG